MIKIAKLAQELYQKGRHLNSEFSQQWPNQYKRYPHFAIAAAALLAALAPILSTFGPTSNSPPVSAVIIGGYLFGVWHAAAYMRENEQYYDTRFIFPISITVCMVFIISLFGISDVALHIFGGGVLFCWALSTLFYRNVLSGGGFPPRDSGFIWGRGFVLLLAMGLCQLFFVLTVVIQNTTLQAISNFRNPLSAMDFICFAQLVPGVFSADWEMSDARRSLCESVGFAYLEDYGAAVFFFLVGCVLMLSIHRATGRPLVETAENLPARAAWRLFSRPVVMSYVISLCVSGAVFAAYDELVFGTTLPIVLAVSLITYDCLHRSRLHDIFARPSV